MVLAWLPVVVLHYLPFPIFIYISVFLGSHGIIKVIGGAEFPLESIDIFSIRNPSPDSTCTPSFSPQDFLVSNIWNNQESSPRKKNVLSVEQLDGSS